MPHCMQQQHGDGRRTCTACRSAKVKCDRMSPICGRCDRLQLPCVEQVRKQGRPALSSYLPGQMAVGGGGGGGGGHGGSGSSSSASSVAGGGGGGGVGGGGMPPHFLQQRGVMVGPGLQQHLQLQQQQQQQHLQQQQQQQQKQKQEQQYSDDDDEHEDEEEGGGGGGGRLASSSSLSHLGGSSVGAGGRGGGGGGGGEGLSGGEEGTIGPQMMTDFIITSFDKLRGQGEVDVPKTLRLLRTLSLQQKCWKRDFSGGLLDLLLTRLGLPPSHLQNALRLEWAPETPARLAELGVKFGEGGREGGGEEGSLEFGRIPPRLAALDDRVSASVCTVSLHGAACRVLVNHQFKDLFCSASELLGRMQSESVAPPLMYASLVAAEDRLDFLEAMTKYLFGHTKEVELSQIVKMRDSLDVTFLAVIRLRVLTLAGGAYLATMLTVSPAPSSKYIRGGNREGPNEGGLTWLGLNQAEGNFRLRPPAPPLTARSDLGKEFEICNLEVERVRAFVSAQQLGGGGGGAGGMGGGMMGGVGGGMGGGGVGFPPPPMVPSAVPQSVYMPHSHQMQVQQQKLQLQQQQQQQIQPLARPVGMEVGRGGVGGGVNGEGWVGLRPLPPPPLPPPPSVPVSASVTELMTGDSSSSSSSSSSNGENPKAPAAARSTAAAAAAVIEKAAAATAGAGAAGAGAEGENDEKVENIEVVADPDKAAAAATAATAAVAVAAAATAADATAVEKVPLGTKRLRAEGEEEGGEEGEVMEEEKEEEEGGGEGETEKKGAKASV